MKPVVKYTSFLAITVCLVITSISSVWAAPEHKDRVEYIFGIVPQFEQRKLFSIWRPILDELEKRTGLFFKIVGSPKIPVFEKKYMEGIYDFAYMNPYHILKAHDSQGYTPLVRDGGRVLKGVLVVKKDSSIQNLKELANKQVAFPAPNALGASLLMRADLAQLHGVEIIPNYVQTHSSVYLHVATGMVEAGGGVASTLRSQKPDVQNNLRVLYETRHMSPHPVTVHPRVPPEDAEKVRQAFLAMAQTEDGAALLSKIPMRETITASMDDYSPMLEWGLDAFYVEQ